ncbi:MAG: ArsR family transcriptional regulator [Oscillospiraceae bacterium]|nr:ArsR family transcriptional regulator [Oscillospiraceae bacterium]
MADMIIVGADWKTNDRTFDQRQKEIEREAKARQKAKKSKYKKFDQVNLAHDACVARCQLINTSPIATQIWEFLLELSDGYNVAMCSVKVFEEALGYTKQSITKALRVLRDMKFVDVKKSGTSNVYLLNMELVWKSWGSNCKYAEFAAKIIISESEQEKPVKTTKMNVVRLKEDSKQRGKDSQQTEESEWEECPEE